jgi:RNA polymerase sigma-70 factor (ECF subfamily)
MISENSIVEGCLNNNKIHQRELYRRYSGKMMAVCLRYTNSRSEAEDMLQEGFIKVFDKIKSFKGKGSLEGWVKRVIINNNLNIIRQNKIRFENIDDISDEFLEPIIEDITLNEKVLLDMISNLPKGYKYVFNMFAIEGMSHKEIASNLGISEVSSRSQYVRARKHLQKQIVKLENGKIS